MYKNFYEKEIKEISKILEKENIHIIETWTNFQKYIYNTSDEKNICTDLVLTLDQNPKYMRLIDLEKIENYIKLNPLRPENFSLKYYEYNDDDDFSTENVDFDIFKYDLKDPSVSIKINYETSKNYEDFNIIVKKNENFYSKNFITYVNNIIEDLENEFDVDLSSEKFDLTYKEKIMRESWTKIYNSPIFGEYTLRFKIYEENHQFTIEVENSFTDAIYKVENNFSSCNTALEWAEYIANELISINNKCLSEKLKQRRFSCKETIYQ